MVRQGGLGVRGRAPPAERRVALNLSTAAERSLAAVPQVVSSSAETVHGPPSSRPVGWSRRILRHLGGDDAVGIRNRLAPLDLVDVSHAFGHLAPDGILAIEKRRLCEADEKLAVGGIRRLRPRHRYGAAAVGLFVELRLELPAGAAGAGAMGTASLRHEALDDAVKRDAIVEALAHQFLDARDMAGGEVRPHQNDDLALGGVQRQRIFGVGHGMFSACLSFRLSMNRTVNGRPAIAFPSASVNGKGAQRLSILATAMR